MTIKNEWKSATDGSEDIWGGGHLQDQTETWNKGGPLDSVGVTLAVIHYMIRDMEPERLPPVTKQEPEWKCRDISPLVKLSTQNLSVLVVMQTQGREKRLRE